MALIHAPLRRLAGIVSPNWVRRVTIRVIVVMITHVSPTLRVPW